MNLIFPVAGQGSRFGGVFKPFLEIGDISFIEKAYEPFIKYERHIDRLVFIFTRDQEVRHNVRNRLVEMFEGKNVEAVIIEKPTHGPLETIQEALRLSNISGPSIVCDCDHSLNVDPIFEVIEDSYDCLIPTWSIGQDEYSNWSKVLHDDKGIHFICEKEHVSSESYHVDGIIGCIWFKDICSLKETRGVYISDALKDFISKNKSMKTVPIKEAYFFGTPEMYERCVDILRGKSTIFCDIDGTLVKHKDHSDFETSSAHPCPGYANLKKLSSEGHKIVLTSARNEKYRDKLEPYLKSLGIHYDTLVLGLPPGPRFLINDRKPSKKFTKQSNSFEIVRDSGIENLDIESVTDSNNIEIVTKFNGNSFAETYLLKQSDRKFIRKHIVKNSENHIHCETLKRQAEDLRRIGSYSKGITPEVYKIVENDFEVFYDMEYLEGHTKLEDACSQQSIDSVLSKVDEDIYSIRRNVEGLNWLNSFLDRKIYAKFEKYSKHKTLRWLIESDFVTINGRKYQGMRNLLGSLNKRMIKPNFICPVHGDFTLENIMVSKDGQDVKLIDMDGADYLDAPELDLGKMCQSLLSDYQSWRSLNDSDLIQNIDDSLNSIDCVDYYFNVKSSETLSLLRKWSDILNDTPQGVEMKGIFYMATYFIRFIPFRMKVSSYHGVFAMVMAIIWMSKLEDYYEKSS
jgi:aminoglycoside phosphotransferase (APT) family kinase protein/GTP:adenosylcobinamide-phosphate guanylyltransferase